MTRLAVTIAAALCLTLLNACGSPDAQSSTSLSRETLDRRDSQALARQVNTQITDRAQLATNGVVEARTNCTKQSDTTYKCLTSFTSPFGLPDAVTDVTCDRNGMDCITETRP